MSNELLNQLTIEWYYERAAVAVVVGYLLRWLEHVIWATDNKNGQSRADVLRWGLVSLPQCVLVGFAGGYLLTAIIANVFESQTIVDVCGYAIPAMMSFLAPDLRDLLRRWSGRNG